VAGAADPSRRPRIVLAEPLDEVCLAWLAERCDVVRAWEMEGEIEGLLREAEGLVVRTYTRVDAALLELAPRLRVVGRAGVGVDNIDLGACDARGVRVVNTPDANTSAVVEYVFALILDALRPRVFLAEAPSPEEWKSLRAELIAHRQLCESTLGVLGLGRIGRGVARAAQGFGMRVLFHDLLDIPESKREGAEPVSRETLLREADILTIHVDGRPENRGLVDAGAMGLLKDDVVLINTSRGFVVDAGALASFLDERPEAMALLDVHDPEPFDESYPLLELENAHLAPHLGAATKLAHRNMSWVVREVWEALRPG